MITIPKLFKKYTLLFFAIVFVQVAFGQFTIPEKPAKQSSVYDYAKILTASQKAALEKKLINYADSTSTQIVIATVRRINGLDIGVLTPRWAHEWGIGQSKEDNGVFILLAEKERKIWISPGYGAEIKLTAGINGTITRNIIIPEFKKRKYYAGLDKGTDAIFEVLKGTFKNTQSKKRASQKTKSKFPVRLVIIVIFIIIAIISRITKGGGGNGRGGRRSVTSDILTAILLSGAGRSHGSFGGGSSGGGFSGGGGFGGGFGGGGFSGGGAGGSW